MGDEQQLNPTSTPVLIFAVLFGIGAFYWYSTRASDRKDREILGNTTPIPDRLKQARQRAKE